MRSTLVGVFENRPAAERAREELLRAGFADDEVDLRTGTEDRAWRESDERRLADGGRAYDDETQSSVGETVADWFRSLFGMDDDADFGIYTEAMRRGESVVTVHATDEDRVDRASDILEACGSIDIDEKASEWERQGWTRSSGTDGAADEAPTTTASTPLGATAASAGAMGAASMRDAGDRGANAAGDRNADLAGDSMREPSPGQTMQGAAGEELHAGESRTIPVIEEQLRVGKRVVGRRRLRVYTRMVDEPVQENVRLSEEHVRVEHRDADRPATESDYRAAQNRSLELTERREEPVVAKESRVVGEVEVGKERREHEETVRDTVRHTDVEVRKLDDAERPAGAGTAGAGTTGAPDGTGATGAGSAPHDPDAAASPPPPDVRR